MISHGKDIKIFTGNSNPDLAAEICKIIGTKLGESEVKTFADGEVSVSLYETVRGSDVFLINSTCKPVNDSLMELLIMIDACKRASAGRVTAVVPYFGYARQDRKAKSRDPISAKLVANMITAAGADRVLTMDLHAAQIQGFFDIPVDNLFGNPVFVDYYAKKFGEKAENMVVVSPDVGSVARARSFAQKLGMNISTTSLQRWHYAGYLDDDQPEGFFLRRGTGMPHSPER
jgi:ribose-phosphate pyrophosphokinase